MDNLLRQIPNIGNYKSSQLISEGISNQNYKIILENNSTATLLATLFPNENIWWKADKEKFITNFYSKNNIPSATVLNTGYITHNQLKYRYLLREFVQEKDFSALLMDNKTLLPNDWISLLTDLGDILGILHKIHLDSYGLVRDGSIPESNIQLINPVNSWSDYMDKVMEDKKHLSSNLDSKRMHGEISGEDIQNIFIKSYVFYNNHRSSLVTVSNASLIHYDLLLNNIIVNYNLKKKHWEISAIIDNEWVSTGDSDIDLIQLENCIYFNQHRDTFKRYWKFFEKAYMRHGIISKDIAEKRVIYHMTRSLFYLMEVYRKDREKVVYPTNSTIRNIKNNYKFLQRLVSKGEIDFSLFS